MKLVLAIIIGNKEITVYTLEPRWLHRTELPAAQLPGNFATSKLLKARRTVNKCKYISSRNVIKISKINIVISPKPTKFAGLFLSVSTFPFQFKAHFSLKI